jgi:hypothetical protein
MPARLAWSKQVSTTYGSRGSKIEGMIGRYFVALLLAVALAGCGRDGSAAALNEPVQLAPGQSAVFKADKLEITFVEAGADSRCPTDVTCVWQGTVPVRLAIRSSGKVTQHEADVATDVAVDGYVVDVLDVLPARGPQSQRIAPADYRVTLKVTPAKSQ